MNARDDVIVVGAGPAGALAALILARAGARVRIFERARFPRAKLCGDTVNPGGWRVLARHVAVDTLCAQGLRIDGMVLTGPRSATIQGRYGIDQCGYALERRVLDMWLLEQAMRSGARVEHGCTVENAIVDGGGVTGVQLRRDSGCATATARLVIAADGRHSRLSFTLGLIKRPTRPRRWAIGAYFSDVDGLTTSGEMHVRAGHYIGVAPLPAGLANACLVMPYAVRDPRWRDPATMLTRYLADDPRLASRFARARMVNAPVVLGPMAVEATGSPLPGLLVAGDAGGFIDPMTGDGITLAWRSAEIAAHVALDVLSGRISSTGAAEQLARRRRQAFRAKWRFNRTLRQLVSSPLGVNGAAVLARRWPQAFEAVVRYAGDVRRGEWTV